MNPLRTLGEAATLPFKALCVVGLCLLINWMTSPGDWWVQWVALGMGIAVLVAWGRALRLVFTAAVLGAVAAWAYRRWGGAGRATAQQWGQPPAPPAPPVPPAAPVVPARDAAKV